MIKALGHNFIFQFLDETSDGRFINRTKSNIILTNLEIDKQGQRARWGKVTSVGKDVVDFVPGDYVLIEPLKWTTHSMYQNERWWKSDDTQVLLVTNDINVTYEF